MKKIYYLFVGLLLMGIGVNDVLAKDSPTFTSTFEVTKIDTNTINLSTIVKNSVTTCNDTGVKNGAVYIKLNNDELENIPANLSGIAVYRDYNENTKSFKETNMLCTNVSVSNSQETLVKCNFGRSESTLINYSDCKDELKINLPVDLCDANGNCTVNVSVKGEAIDYNGGNPTQISAGVTTFYEKTYDCNEISTMVENDSSKDDVLIVENPNTLDSTSIYFIICLVSLAFMCVLLKPNKKARNA